MVKFSQQTEAQPTRKSQLISQRENKQNEEEYNRLRAKAEAVKQERFSNISTPEQYQSAYSQLDPDLLPFFATPSEIKQQQEMKVASNIQQADARIAFYQGKIAQRQQEIEKNRAYYNSLQGSARDRFAPTFEANERKYQEDIESYNEYIGNWQQAKSRLQQGYDYGDVQNSIESSIQYKQEQLAMRRKERADEQRKATALQKAIAEGNLEVFEETVPGQGTQRKVYVQNQGQRFLVGVQKPQYEEGKKSDLGTIRVKQQVTVDGKDTTIETTEQLYVDSEGNLFTRYGKIGRTEKDIYSEQQAAQEAYDLEKFSEAQTFLESRNFGKEKSEAQPSFLKKILGDTWMTAKTVYFASPFGRTIPASEQANIKRSRSYLASLSSADAVAELRSQAQREKTTERKSQLIQELDDAVNAAPEELKYYVLQEGGKTLQTKGITALESKGMINFGFNEKPLKPFNVFAEELEMQREADVLSGKRKDSSISAFTNYAYPTRSTLPSQGYESRFVAKLEKPVIVNVRSGFLKTSTFATETVKYYGIAKVAGVAISGAGKVAGFGKGVLKSAGLGTRISSGTVKAGTVTATLEPIVRGSFSKGVTKFAGSVGKTTLTVGAGSYFVASSVKYVNQMEAQFGKAGRKAAVSETSGQFASVGVLLGEGLVNKYQANQMNKRIAMENYRRQTKAAELRNLKQYGLDSRTAREAYIGIGEQRGNLRAGIYKKGIKVLEPIDERTLYERYSYSSVRSIGKKEVAIDLNRLGKPKSISTSVKGKRYALTNVFDIKNDQLVLKKTIASKLVKSSGSKFAVENRLVRTYSRQKFSLREAMQVGLKDLRQKEIAKMFSDAGAVSRISVSPSIGNRRVLKLSEDAFRFKEFGYSDRTKGLKNVLKDFDFADIFSDDVVKKSNKNNFKDILASSEAALKSSSPKKSQSLSSIAPVKGAGKLSLQNIDISATLKDELKIKIVSKVIPKVSPRQERSLGTIVALSLGQRQRQRDLVKNRINARQRTNYAQVSLPIQEVDLRQGQQETQKERTTTRSLTSQIASLIEPQTVSVNLNTFEPRIRTPPSGRRGGFFGVKDDLFLKEKVKRRRKSRSIESYAYTPDLTSRVIGIKPIDITSERQAQKLLRKIQTGFEVKPSVRIRIPK